MIPELLETIEGNTLTLLQAEPGAGKTTRVPAAILAAGYADVYVLEPRRLAVRMAARRVAEEMDERVGETVGYQVRFEDVSSSHTRLWYFTEGVLTRKILSDRNLSAAQVVILDEFTNGIWKPIWRWRCYVNCKLAVLTCACSSCRLHFRVRRWRLPWAMRR